MEGTPFKNIDLSSIGLDKNNTKASAYSAIGFDMDHCQLQYKLKHLFKTLLNANCQDLIEHFSYPKELLITPEEETKILSFIAKTSLDLEYGNVQKLGKGGVVLRAYHGLRQLEDQEIQSIYGEERKFKRQDLKNLTGDSLRSMNEFYATHLAATFTKIVILKDSQNHDVLNKKSYVEINNDIQACIVLCYCHWTEEIVHHIKESGKFFPCLYKDPLSYLNVVEQDFIDCVKALRAKGKFVFLLTNSHWYFAETNLNAIFKESWKDLFDLIIVFGQKPNFWKKDLEKPFYKLDLSVPTLKGSFNGNFEDEANKILISGSMKDLDVFFVNKFGENYRGIYFGDSPISDIQQLMNFNEKNWDGAYILEELKELTLSKSEFLEEFPDYLETWGSGIQEKDPRKNEDQIDTLHFDRANNNVFKTFSSVYSKECYDFLKN